MLYCFVNNLLTLLWIRLSLNGFKELVKNVFIIYSPSRLFQTWMSFFLLLNRKEDILKNVGNQTVDDTHWFPLYYYFFSFNENQWLLSTAWLYQYSLKYLLLSSAEERNAFRFGTTWGWVMMTIFTFFVWYNWGLFTFK